MGNNDQEIIVVARETLFAEKYFQGFIPAKDFDFESVILNNFKYERRGNAEENPDLKQPIAYCLIVNKTTGKVFIYQRSAIDGEYNEKRLQGKWSWGVGGHMERYDVGDEHPIRASMLRELEEEVKIDGSIDSRVLGYINDDETAVGKVHFGILYLIETDAASIVANDAEIATGGFAGPDRIQEILSSPDCEVESWSEIAAEPLMDALG